MKKQELMDKLNVIEDDLRDVRDKLNDLIGEVEDDEEEEDDEEDA